MRVRLDVSEERKNQLIKELVALGITIDDTAELTLSDSSVKSDSSFLSVRDESGAVTRIPAEEIIYIESYGHDVIIHCTEGRLYAGREPLYRIMQLLDPLQFLRVSNSAIIQRKHVKRIRSSFSMKFVLTMSDDTLVDVTRSYYYAFKDFFKF
ncbi:MAG: LytTR family transcriptional regulator [Lachnospiraceae bacterium]|nr:LytTR family transcriptional regulator [Lachnospiraceae bacterium]